MMREERKGGSGRRLLQLALGVLVSSGMVLGMGAVEAAEPQQPEGELGRQEQVSKKAAIVIDDFGNQMQGTQDMLNLPIPITVAVMPFLPTTKQDAELAHSRGKDVIIHMPMEPVKGKKSWLGPGAITSDLSDQEVRKRVEAAVDEVPYAIGMNNHMGSKITSDPKIMRIILEVCKERNLFFLDSKTTGKSVVGKLCVELGVPTASNNLFFDDVYTMEHIMKQAELFKKKLQKEDQLIAIGHVGPPGKKTAFALKKIIPELDGKVEFVPVKELVK
jgi:uncharacterized protein